MIKKIIAHDWRATCLSYKLAYFLYLPIVFSVGLIMSQMFVLPFSVWMALSYSLNPFFVEAKGELNSLYMTLPVKRSQIVVARYLFSLIMLVIGVAAGLAIMPVARYFSTSRWYLGISGNIAMVAVSVLVFSVLSLFMLPPLFKLGYHKGKIISLYITPFVFAAISVAYFIFMVISEYNTTLDFIVFASENMLLVTGGIMAVSALILWLSYRLSMRFYLRRDF